MDSRILPESFCDAYEALHVKAFRDGSGDDNHPLNGNAGALEKASGAPVGQWRESSGTVTSIGAMGAAKMKQVGKTSKFMRDERAWKAKIKMDKRLRRMAKEMIAIVDGTSPKAASHRICSGKCKRLGDYEWKFCANCGGPMREMEETEA